LKWQEHSDLNEGSGCPNLALLYPSIHHKKFLKEIYTQEEKQSEANDTLLTGDLIPSTEVE
jgi:hypothetical protein